MMKILAWARSTLRRSPSSSEVLADFSRILEGHDSHPSIEHCLAAVLRRCLRRTIIVIPMGSLSAEEKTGKTESANDEWTMDRGTIATWLEGGRFGPTAESTFTELFGGISGGEAKGIAALVPVLSARGLRLATVVVGRKRFRPLTDAERRLIAAAVGMTTLLFEQARLRDMLDVAAAEAETVKRLVAGHCRHARLRYHIDHLNLN
jgi:hypothetical protein